MQYPLSIRKGTLKMTVSKAPRYLLACCAIVVSLLGCAGTAPDRPAVPAPALPVAATGEIAQAPYRIDIPERWNGDLVLFAHGYEPVGVPRETPTSANELARSFLDRGYAFAGSSYRTQGWAVADAVADTEALRQHFIASYGAPKRTFLLSISMGGQIVLASMEQQPEAYSGALSLCGVNAPPADVMRDGVLGPLVAFDLLFPAVLGLPAGGLADPAAAPMVDGNAIEAALAANEPTATLLSTQFDIPRHELAGALWLRYLVLRELATRAGGFPVDNRGMVYSGFGDDAAFNAGVRRYTGDPAAMDYLARTVQLSGQVRAPVLFLLNNNDPTVPERFGERYLGIAADAGASAYVALLAPVGEGHCAFLPHDITAAFDKLVAWVESGVRPVQ